MSYLYLDTSAVVKRYLTETGSNWVQNLLDPTAGNSPILGEITQAEFAAAVSTKQKIGVITATERVSLISLFLSHCNTEYQLSATNPFVIDRAIILAQNYFLRGYDAVQLATALIAGDTLKTQGITDFIFVSADNSLLAAATAEGLTVENPNTYP